MNDHQKNPNKSSLKDEIIGLLKEDEVNTIIQRYLIHTKKLHQTKTIINAVVVFLGFLIGVGGFTLAYQASADQTRMAIQKTYEQQKSLDIQARIRRKIQWMRKINESIINMRKLRYQIVLQCENNKPISTYQQELLRFNARVDFINAFTGSNFIFNDAEKEKSLELVAFDESVKNVCSKNAPKDIKWREYLIEINNIMGQSIKNDQDMLNNLDK